MIPTSLTTTLKQKQNSAGTDANWTTDTWYGNDIIWYHIICYIISFNVSKPGMEKPRVFWKKFL